MTDRRTVTFGLLGQLEIQYGGSNVTIGSPKVRTLLAALLLRPSRPRTIHELSETIWGDRQPDNPRRALQLCATRLRAYLADAGAADLLVTRADGYCLEIGPSDIDVGKVEERLAAADRARADGDAATESFALSEALAHWRGDPLADIPSDRLQIEAAPRLRELHLQIIERRIDVDLERGLHSELVGELFELTSKHATRERMWAQLMTALHRSGRRAEALRTYHTVRGHLADELGIDPGDELRQVHASILNGRVSGSRSFNIPPVPRQLPAGVGEFVGRSDEVSRLDARDAVTVPTVCLITGRAGVGKTSLALHWARRAADRFPDGLLWADLHGDRPGQAVAPTHVLVGFLHALGVAYHQIPFDVGDQAALYRSMMDGRRMLIVLDNAFDAQQVRALLPGAAGCHILVTSRYSLDSLVAAEFAHVVHLDVFRPDEARTLLLSRLGNGRVHRNTLVDELVDTCGGLPLALSIVGTRASALPEALVETLARQLRQHQPRNDIQRDGASDEVRPALFWSYASLSPPAGRLFRLLAYHPGPEITPQASASLAATTESEASSLLAELSGADLVMRRAQGRFTMHDLVRAYATELAYSDGPDVRDACVRRLLDHYILTLRTAALATDPQLRPIREEPEPGVTPEVLDGPRMAMSWFVSEWPGMLRLLDLANRHGFPAHAVNLAVCIQSFLEKQDH